MFCRTLFKASSFVCKSSLFAALVLVMSACNDEFSLKELDYNQEETRTDQNLEVWDGSIANEFNGGNGTAESPYLIANGKQLARFAAIVNGTLDGTTQNKAACGKLTADILLNNTEGWESWGDESTTELKPWTPIGSSIHQFTGILDGDGHSISGIYINDSEEYRQGLVGYLGVGGTIQNLGVKASYIKGDRYVGGVCGTNYGSMTNCYNTGNVVGNRYVGGVCGQNNSGTVTNCYNTGSVTCSTNYVGGVCGENDRGNVANCYNTGNVTGTGYYVGGVCGLNRGTVTNCYNTGSVTGTSNHIGGVCGLNSGTVTNCYYLDNCGAKGEGTPKTNTQFQSGEVAYLLSQGADEGIWGQNLTFDPNDNYPVLGGLKVVQIGDGYANVLNQDSDGFYMISNADDLHLFASMVNGGQINISAKLTADIELNNTTDWENWGNTPPANSWTPIGSDIHQFTGTLDGDGHSISGIYINDSDADYQGLVGYLGEGGTLKNLGVKASYIKGYSNVGGVCGQNNNGGTVSNCHNNGSVEGDSNVGGVCGQNNNGGNVSNCYNTGRVTGMYWVGGVCGRNYNGNNKSNYHNTVSNCYNTGNVEGITNVGGVCGQNYNGGEMSNYYNTVSNCYNTGNVEGDKYVGGVCGTNNNEITVNNCYNIVNNCYNYGSVTGTKSVGGVCGQNYNGNNVIDCYSTVTNCHNTGNVTGTESVGGVCGENPSGTVGNCYYLTGKALGGINGSDTEGQAEEKTAEQFKSGEVAYLLGEGWGQTIGTDNYPVLTTGASKKVYAYTMYQGQSTETGYVNNNGSIDLDLTSHPNTIAVFEAPGTFAGKNVVVKNSDNSYTCNNLVLTDNASFYTPVPFTAQTATYTRTPKVWAIRDSNGSGWETICIPFSGSLYADGNKLQPVDKDTNNGNYWLRSLTGFEAPNTLLFTSPQTAEGDMIKAGVPYLIALPGETFGVESLEGKDITVIGKNVTINNSTNPIEVGDGLFIFTSEYTETATENFHYRLNSELNGESGAGDLFKACAGGTSIPFRCRIEVNGLNIGGAASRSGSSLPQVLKIGQ